MKTKKLLSILVLILIISFAYASYNIALTQFKLSDTNNSYLAGLTWHRSAAGLEKGFQIAQQENKPIAMYFWAIWCQYCARFQSDTLGNPQIKEILEKDYVLVAMDLDLDKDIADKYSGWPPPQVVFLDGSGKVLDRVIGAQDANYFLPIATKVRDQIRGK